MTSATDIQAPRSTANPAPARQANSVRRTTSIDVSWPDGTDKPRLFIGRARDLKTPATGGLGEVLGQAEIHARLNGEKKILSISADPAPANLDALVGQRAGGHLRMFLKESMPDLLEKAAPLYLILDDLSGTALVSNISWSMWERSWREERRAAMSDEGYEDMMAGRANVCWGLKEGNSGLKHRRDDDAVSHADAGELRNPEDPKGWHEFPESDGPGFRRARRIEVSRDAATGLLMIDSAFQDAAKTKIGGRVAIHEYILKATANPDTLELLTLEPVPRILPFPECPGAIPNTQRLVGSRISDIRDEVLAQLRGPEGCTHLNDAMRALADVPILAGYL
ncbi:MAG: DUF2889 domain-containing protein [Sphingomonadaceae bacterium]|nr:DUF2889 domain-containing protein [Sphingomonadaceae bacterium]